MKKISPLLIVVLAWTATTAFAQWQWLDKDGRKVFSDRAPPADVQDKDILKRPTLRATSAAPEAPASPADGNAGAPKLAGQDKELEAKRKQAADAEAQRKQQEEERITRARIENCARAKQAKVTMDSGMAMAQVNKSGDREVMDDATRSAEARRIQGIINSDCR